VRRHVQRAEALAGFPIQHAGFGFISTAEGRLGSTVIYQAIP
jgi:hypothetical protein